MRTKPNREERQLRHQQALLLFFVFLVLAAGTALLLFTKIESRPRSASPLVNINRVKTGVLAEALAVPMGVAQKIVDARRGSKDAFGDVDAIKRLRGRDGKPVVSVGIVNAAAGRLIVREWPEARNLLLAQSAALALFFLVAHIAVRRLAPRADPYLLPSALFLSTLGILLLFGLKDPIRDQLTSLRQTYGLILGGGLALLIPLLPTFGKLPLHRYKYAYAVAAVLGAVVLGIFGSGPAGVKLSVGGTQPVEFIKILMVFFLAAYLADSGVVLNDVSRRRGVVPVPRRKDLLPLLVLYALPLGVFALVRDLGPALLLFGAFLLLLYAATGAWFYVALGTAVVGLGGYFGYALKFGVFRTRVDMFLSPWSNPYKGGDQLAHGLWALASGGVWGSGLGLGGPEFVPRGGSDLIFATLGESCGLLGSLAVIAVFLVLIERSIRIANRLTSEFERYLAYGLGILLGLQCLVILWGNLGLFPLTGITLPFVAYGRTSQIASFFLIGVLIWLSGKCEEGVVVPPAFRTVSRSVFLFFLVAVGVVSGIRLLYLQGLAADYLMSRSVTTPDADGVRRAHINPRLLMLAARIDRGRILDRNGNVLAETRSGRRLYPLGAASGHLIGYVDAGVGGPSGLESRFDSTLRGFAEWRDLCPYWRFKDFPNVSLPKGKDLKTTLDANLQRAAFAALQKGVPTKRGAAVVLDTTTGGVLAAATLPAYDPNTLTPAQMQRMSQNADKQYALINRATSGYYPPGSTYKIVTATAMLSMNRADFTTTCQHVARNTVWKVDGKTYARKRIVDDEGETPHGQTNLTKAVRDSCNVYFARAGIGLGGSVLSEFVARFGFSKKASGLEWDAELPDMAYGQGPVLATPLEMAGVAQTVANGGTRIAPTFLVAEAAKSQSEVMRAAHARTLSEMMQQVTESGTAAGKFRGLGYAVAGKTGTAENDRYDRKSHAWFIGFAPARRPQLAFAVIAENSGYGARYAAPIAREILTAVKLNR